MDLILASTAWTFDIWFSSGAAMVALSLFLVYNAIIVLCADDEKDIGPIVVLTSIFTFIVILCVCMYQFGYNSMN